MKTASQHLAAFIAGLAYDDLPAATVTAAKFHALDAIGCGIAAQALDEASFVTEAAGEVAKDGPATAIGKSGGLPATEAALVNGTLMHALDYDDTHPDSIIHVSVGVTSAALAAAEVAETSGQELICALVAGNEVSIRLGMAAGGRFHARGFHPTGVCGVFGATAAAARVRGLDAERTANALGIAGSMSSGLLEFLADGTKTKPLHPGWAAHAGIMAARLAAHGATGPDTVLDGRRGFFSAYLHGDSTDVEGQVSDLGSRWTTPQIAYKPYPACHYTHAPLDALAELIAEEGLEAEEVSSIVAVSDETGAALVLNPLQDKLHPRTPYDAKFSLPYCLSTLLVRGRVGVESFTADAIADREVLKLAGRVTAEIKQYSAAPDAFPGGVRVSTRDGRMLEAELRYQRGGEENLMSDNEVVGKWRENAELALTRESVRELETMILNLEECEDLGTLSLLADAAVRNRTSV